MEASKAYVFVNYAREDSEMAARICPDFKEKAYTHGLTYNLFCMGQRWSMLETASTQSLLGEIMEPAFDHVEPLTESRGKMKTYSRVALQS